MMHLSYYFLFACILIWVENTLLQETRLYIETVASSANTTRILTSKVQVQTNVTEKSVEFHYREDDDSLKSWTVFYEKHIQIFKSINLGEIDLGEPVYRFHCFIMFFDASKIAPLKVMAEMKQEDFNSIQKADTQLNPKAYGLDHVVMRGKLKMFGDSVYNACHEADLILTNVEEVRKISEKLNLQDLLHTISLSSSLDMFQYPLCQETNQHWDMKCRCKTNVFIDWYPCAPKLCENYNALLDDEDNIPYTCGVSTCVQKHQFVYLVEKVLDCMSV